MKKIATLVMAGALGLSGVACKKDNASAPSTASVETGASNRESEKVKVTDIDLGRSIDGDKQIKDKETKFSPKDTIYASVDTKGESPGTQITAVWRFQDGQEVHRDAIAIAPDGKEHTEFHISKPDGWPKGDYSVEITVGNQKPRKQSFSVK